MRISKNKAIYLSPHLSSSEFQCSGKGCCTSTLISDDFPAAFEKLRATLAAPIYINSGYRCPKHNAAVGGAKASHHTQGLAADLRCAAVNPVCFAIVAQQYFKGVGIYWYGSSAFIHVDLRPKKTTWLCIKSGKYNYTSDQPFILPTIKKGDTSLTTKAAIQMLQRLLNTKVTGVFDQATENALKLAQTNNNLPATGICNEATWKAISGANKYL